VLRKPRKCVVECETRLLAGKIGAERRSVEGNVGRIHLLLDESVLFRSLLLRTANGAIPLQYGPSLHNGGRFCIRLPDSFGKLALDAYHASLHGKLAPVIDGLTGDQRVFLGWAQAWRTKRTDAAVHQLVVSYPHSPSQYRVNGPVRNIDAWYESFEIKLGDKLYLAPQDRVHIW
jgi:hypothetical protein